jgi:hypothetical protein
MNVIIVGGVAGGASCAARLRRLDEKPKSLWWNADPMSRMRTAGCPSMSGA